MASQRTAAKAEVATGLIAVKAGTRCTAEATANISCPAKTGTRCAGEAQDTIRARTAPKANVAISNPTKAGMRCDAKAQDADVPPVIVGKRATAKVGHDPAGGADLFE